jgi:hypothetical protein
MIIVNYNSLYYLITYELENNINLINLFNNKKLPAINNTDNLKMKAIWNFIRKHAALKRKAINYEKKLKGYAHSAIENN